MLLLHFLRRCWWRYDYWAKQVGATRDERIHPDHRTDSWLSWGSRGSRPCIAFQFHFQEWCPLLSRMVRFAATTVTNVHLGRECGTSIGFMICWLGYYGLLTTYWCVLLLYRTIHIPNFSISFNFNMYFNAYYLVYSEDLSEGVNHGPLSPSLHCWYCRGSAYPIWLRLGILGMNGKFYYPPNKGRVLWPLWLMGVYGIIMYDII